MAESDSPRYIQSVLTTTELLSCIRDSNGATVSQLADRTDLSPGTVHTHLSTLQEAGFIVQDEREYGLGPQFLALGETVRNHSELYQASKQQVNTLAEENGECAHLILEHGGKLFALYERFGSEAVGVKFHDRKREKPINHLHCTAAGKAILAHLPEERVQHILQTGKFPQNTPNSITDPAVLLDELEEVRHRGFAVADEEQMEGIRAVGAPIIEGNDTVAGAIAVSGPSTRLQGEFFRDELPQTVMQAANICEVNLQSINLEEQYV